MSDMKYFDQSFIIRQNSGSESEDGVKVYYDGTISTGKLDAYNTHMSDQVLRSYAKTAREGEGVPVLALHDQTLQIGRSESGKFNNIEKSVQSKFYLQKNLPLNGPGYGNSNAYIESVDAGTMRGLSIGAKVEEETCDFCNSDMKRYSFLGMTFAECQNGHYPGQKIYVDRKGNEVKEPKKGLKQITITSTIQKADLKEFSVVSFAATPGAKVITNKARKALADGKLEEKHLIQLSDNYNIARSDIESTIQPIPKRGTIMDDKKDLSQTDIVELKEELARVKTDLENSKELYNEYQTRYDQECVKTTELEEKVDELEQIQEKYHQQEAALSERDAEIADLQKRMVNIRHIESKSERYDQLLETAREEVVFQYVRANNPKCTPEMEERKRKSLESCEDYTYLVNSAALYRDDARRAILGKDAVRKEPKTIESKIDEWKYR